MNQVVDVQVLAEKAIVREKPNHKGLQEAHRQSCSISHREKYVSSSRSTSNMITNEEDQTSAPRTT